MLKKDTLSDIVYNYLKENIMDKTLKAGEKINIDNLVEKIQVSKVPIREALKRLQQEGLVQYKTNSGMSVAKISYEESKNIIEILNKLTGVDIKINTITNINQKETIELYFNEIKKSENTKLINISKMLCNQLKLWDGTP